MRSVLIAVMAWHLSASVSVLTASAQVVASQNDLFGYGIPYRFEHLPQGPKRNLARPPI